MRLPAATYAFGGRIGSGNVLPRYSGECRSCRERRSIVGIRVAPGLLIRRRSDATNTAAAGRRHPGQLRPVAPGLLRGRCCAPRPCNATTTCVRYEVHGVKSKLSQLITL